MNKSTPWGMAQTDDMLAPGIISYSTSSHGGIWLDAEHQGRLVGCVNFLNNLQWWEEDCDWAVPYVFFIDEIREYGKAYHIEENYKSALATVERDYNAWFTEISSRR